MFAGSDYVTRLRSWSVWVAEAPQWVIALICAALVLVPVLLLRQLHPTPYFPDEYAHFDVLSFVAETGHLPDRFSTASSQTADIFACSDLRLGAPLDCGAMGQNPERLPWLGENGATAVVGVWYWVEGLVAGVISNGTGVALLDVLRLMSLAWTLGLAVVVVQLVVRLGGTSSVALGCGVFAGVNPLVLVQSTVVQTDIPAAALALTSILVAVWGPSRLRVVATANALAGFAVLVRWSALIAPLALFALEKAPVRDSGSRLRKLAPVFTVIVVVMVSLVDQVVRTGQGSNGLQDAYVRQNWDQRMLPAVFAAWLRIPATLNYPFSSSEVRPGAGLLEVMAALVLLGCLGLTVWAAHRPGPQRGLARATWVYLLVLPAATMTALAVAGLPLFHQPRYLLPGALLAVVIAGVQLGESRLLPRAVAVVWLTTAVYLLVG